MLITTSSTTVHLFVVLKLTHAYSFKSQIVLQIRSDQSLSRVRLFATPWIAAHQAPCPSPTPGVHPDARPSSQWCHPVKVESSHRCYCIQFFCMMNVLPHYFCGTEYFLVWVESKIVVKCAWEMLTNPSRSHTLMSGLDFFKPVLYCWPFHFQLSSLEGMVTCVSFTLSLCAHPW